MSLYGIREVVSIDLNIVDQIKLLHNRKACGKIISG